MTKCAGNGLFSLGTILALLSSILQNKVREPLIKTTALARHDDNHLPELSCNRKSDKKNVEFLTGRIWEGTKRREETIHPTHLPETLTLESNLAERCGHPQGGP